MKVTASGAIKTVAVVVKGCAGVAGRGSPGRAQLIIEFEHKLRRKWEGVCQIYVNKNITQIQ